VILERVTREGYEISAVRRLVMAVLTLAPITVTTV
jgi:hypothetical protein